MFINQRLLTKSLCTIALLSLGCSTIFIGLHTASNGAFSRVTSSYSDSRDKENNTYLGTSILLSPEKPSGNTWKGNIIYFGNTKPTGSGYICRVLDPHCTKYGEDETILLQCTNKIYSIFGGAQRDVWVPNMYLKETDLYKNLNGDSFLNKEDAFTTAEKEAIVPYTAQANHEFPDWIPSELVSEYIESSKLNAYPNGKIFIPDIEDLYNSDYGYNFINYGLDGWLRNMRDPIPYTTRIAYYYAADPKYSAQAQICPELIKGSSTTGASPMFNIEPNAILFTTAVVGNAGEIGTEYKLTLYDSELSISIPQDNQIKTDGTNIYIPYSISGANAENATQVSVLITDKEYKESDAEILLYKKLQNDSFSTSGEGFFSLPSTICGKWGKDYHVYILAENRAQTVTGNVYYNFRSDYASVPIEISAPSEIIINQSGKDTISLEINSDTTNENVFVCPITDIGYEVDTVTYSSDNSSEIDITEELAFRMSNEKHIITVNFKPTEYSLTVQNSKHGTVVLSQNKAITGESFYIDITSDNAYKHTTPQFFYDDGTEAQGIYGKKYEQINSQTERIYFIMPAANLSVYVEFKPIEYSISLETIRIVDKSSISVSPQKATKGTSITVTAPNTSGRFILDKITYTTKQSGITVDITTSKRFVMPAENVLVTVEYKYKTFTITFDSNGGSYVPDQIVEIGKTAVEPTPPVKDGYIFDGWYRSNQNKWNFYTPIVYSDMCLYAKWIAVTPTPIPTASPTPIITPTKTPVPTVSPTPITTPTSVPTPTLSPTPITTPTSVPTPTLSPTPIITPTSGPAPTIPPTPIITPTSVPTPAVSPTSKPTPTNTGTPTIQPTDSSKNRPSITPPDVSDNNSTKPQTSKQSDVSFEDFVERLYTVAMNRKSDKSGKDYWTNEVKSGNKTGADCARGFLQSPEFHDFGLNSTEFLKVLYKTFFDREPDTNGLNYWLEVLETHSQDEVVEGFINSTEWCNICSSYGVKSGATTAKATQSSAGAIGFATRLYTCCLGRKAESDGLKYWSLALTNLEVTGTQAAQLFFTSEEFINLDTGNKEYITRLYRTFMDREPDDSGMNYWLEQLNGAASRSDVFFGFSTASEFVNICNKYGIDR